MFVVSNCIREYRLKKGLSQSELASMVGVSKNTISSYERQMYQPRLFVLHDLSIVFQCKMGDLMHVENRS